MDAEKFDCIKQRCENQRADAKQMRATATSLRRFARLAYREVQNIRATARARRPAWSAPQSSAHREELSVSCSAR
jgi:hypothetical protein